jgi:hypothetical protein
VKTRRITITLLAAVAFTLTACGHHTPPATSDTTTVAPTTPAPALTPDDMTDLAIDLTWNQTSEADKDTMCAGIAIGGPEWAAEQMQLGASDSSLDWDRAAVLVEAKCALR